MGPVESGPHSRRGSVHAVRSRRFPGDDGVLVGQFEYGCRLMKALHLLPQPRGSRSRLLDQGRICWVHRSIPAIEALTDSMLELGRRSPS